ncbi:MAG: membrane protein insertion efficiency factor YidD [Simkania sp.]|nr:membrane protein insertion efficiency factor YidD [Simkania sp.]
MPGFYEPWGKDADLSIPAQPTVEQSTSNSPMVWTASKIIWFHQNVLSPVDGPRSHFRPSSSGYMLEAMRKHGFIKGYLMGCDRLLRENSEEWVYRTVDYEGRTLKWDPPP